MKTRLLTTAVFSAAAVLGATARADVFALRSTDIAAGRPLTMREVFNGFGCEGGNVSPQLSWSGAPSASKSFAVTVYDPDAPGGKGWWHWTVVNTPPRSIRSPPEPAIPAARYPRARCKVVPILVSHVLAARVRRSGINRTAINSRYGR